MFTSGGGEAVGLGADLDGDQAVGFALAGVKFGGLVEDPDRAEGTQGVEFPARADDVDDRAWGTVEPGGEFGDAFETSNRQGQVVHHLRVGQADHGDLGAFGERLAESTGEFGLRAVEVEARHRQGLDDDHRRA